MRSRSTGGFCCTRWSARSRGAALRCCFPRSATAREDAAGALNEAGRTQVSTRNSLQWLLVGAQVALSVTLLAAAGLLVRSFQELSRVDPGFEPSRVLTFRVSGNWAETANRARLVQRIDGTLEALRALPGVEAAATSVVCLASRPTEETFKLAEARERYRAPDGRRKPRPFLRSISRRCRFRCWTVSRAAASRSAPPGTVMVNRIVRDSVPFGMAVGRRAPPRLDRR